MNRINFKNAVKRLSGFLKNQNISVPHNTVMDAIAIACGYKDYPDYSAKTNDPALVKNKNSKTLIVYHSHKEKIGSQILNAFMSVFEGYYIKAKPLNPKNHPEHFPLPDHIEYQKDKTIITWAPKNGRFPDNTSITILLCFLYRDIVNKYPDIFQHVHDINIIEERTEVTHMKEVLRQIH